MSRILMIGAGLVVGCSLAPALTAQSAPTQQVVAGTPSHTDADAAFMTGMIGHHAQAVLISSWAKTHGASPELQALTERIVVGQTDEIHLMQRWLREWGLPVPSADASHDMMPGMEHMAHQMMPGMLTADELRALDQTRGKAFDKLWIQSMIKHHEGALTMIKDLLATPGAARDDWVFKFISDMNADQGIEIERMTGMLNKLK